MDKLAESRLSAGINLAKIRGFLAVAQHLSFRRAARELGLTQPALSGQIRALEHALGVKLFTRTTRRVALTPDGARCFHRARRLVRDFDAAVVEMKHAEPPQHGIVTCSCIPSIVGHLFPRLILEFRSRHPGIDVQISDDATVAMERRLLNEEVDFGIGGPPNSMNELDFAPVVDDPFVLVCRRDHPLANQHRQSLKRAIKYPIISLAKGSNVFTRLSRHFQRNGWMFNPAHEMVHHLSVFSMVEAGMGIAFLPAMTCEMLSGGSALRALPLDDPSFTRPVGLIKRRSEALSPAAHELYALSAKIMGNGHP